MICDRVKLTCEAIQFTGKPVPVEQFIGAPLMPEHGRYVLMNPKGDVWTFLEPGDWIVRGVGEGFDFYVIKDSKFHKLWKPRKSE